MKAKLTPEQAAQIADTIKKYNINVASVEECAKCDWHLCVDERMDPSDGEGKCFACGKPVFFHNKFPEGGPQPKKICIQCALEKSKGEQAFGA
jgi:hypothetical protein